MIILLPCSVGWRCRRADGAAFRLAHAADTFADYLAENFEKLHRRVQCSLAFQQFAARQATVPSFSSVVWRALTAVSGKESVSEDVGGHTPHTLSNSGIVLGKLW